jgi:hypothetical protein
MLVKAIQSSKSVATKTRLDVAHGASEDTPYLLYQHDHARLIRCSVEISAFQASGKIWRIVPSQQIANEVRTCST